MKRLTPLPGLSAELTLLCGLFLLTAACSSSDDDGLETVTPQTTGTVEIYANGEDFIRESFLSKDGWTIAFEHFYVNLFGPTAIQGTLAETQAAQGSSVSPQSTVQPAHAGHPHTGIVAGGAHVALLGDFLVDLHQTPLAGEGELRTRVGTITGVDASGNLAVTGTYNTVNFNIKPVEREGGAYIGTCPALAEGDCEEAAEAMEGYSLRMSGTAASADESETVGFDIRLLPVLDGDPENSGIAWSSCTWVGEPTDAGLVRSDGTGSVEMTFHSDHIFGNGADPDPALDPFATGFDPFQKLAEAGDCGSGEDRCLTATEEDLRDGWSDPFGPLAENPELQYAYGMLIYALGTLGHSGEGHCLH